MGEEQATYVGRSNRHCELALVGVGLARAMGQGACWRCH